MTSNLPFSEWGQIFQGERMTAALLDRLTHHCAIFEMNGESYRFRESMKTKRARSQKAVGPATSGSLKRPDSPRNLIVLLGTPDLDLTDSLETAGLVSRFIDVTS